MRRLAIIPARGGSKRIPRKNMSSCAGKPLLGHTLEAALGSRLLDRIVLSTDDEEIAALGRASGVEVLLRPEALARDQTPMPPVIRHVLEHVADESGDLEAVVLLQPTSPLRRSRHIDEAMELFLKTRPDAVVSVKPVPHTEHPYKLVRPTPSGLVPYHENLSLTPVQGDLPRVYAKNGPAILIMTPETARSDAIYGRRCLPYEMEPRHSIDVDEPLDLFLAECLLLNKTCEDGWKRP